MKKWLFPQSLHRNIHIVIFGRVNPKNNIATLCTDILWTRNEWNPWFSTPELIKKFKFASHVLIWVRLYYLKVSDHCRVIHLHWLLIFFLRTNYIKKILTMIYTVKVKYIFVKKKYVYNPDFHWRRLDGHQINQQTYLKF